MRTLIQAYLSVALVNSRVHSPLELPSQSIVEPEGLEPSAVTVQFRSAVPQLAPHWPFVFIRILKVHQK